MTWIDVAKKDFQDSIRSYLLWGLLGVFVVLVAAVAMVLGYLVKNPTSTRILGLVHLVFQYLVPLIAIAISFGAIVGERESGSIKLMLALPHSRSDVVFGKLVGRSAAFVLPLAVGLLLPAIGMLLVGVPFQGPKYVGFVLFTALFGVAFISVTVGFSASLESRFQVLIGTFAFYFVFDILWLALQGATFIVILMLSGKWPSWMPLSLQDSILTFKLVSPTGDFFILKRALFQDALFASQVPQGVPGPNVQLSALFMLLFWILGPTLFGIWRFEVTDL